mgnify:CR=1 FL=1
MKKHMTRNMILMLVLDVILGIVLALYIANTGTVPAADNADTYTDGTYTASAQGCLSEVGVTVTITGGKVTNVVIDASGETPELGGKAAETLSASLLAAGSTVGGGCCLRQHHDQRRGICGNERLPCTGRTVMKF